MKFRSSMLALAISGVLSAGTTTTVVNNTSVYRQLPDGATVTIKKTADKTAIQLCMEKAAADAAVSGLATFQATCTDVSGITIVSNCDGVAKPKWPLEKDATGAIIRPQFKDDGYKDEAQTEYKFIVEDFVPAPPPACWIKGWRTAQDIDITGPYEDEVAANLPNSIEPVTPPPGFQKEWDDRQVALAAACAAGDPKSCPQIPNQTPGACGWYYEPSCNDGVDPRAGMTEEEKAAWKATGLK